MGWKDVAKHLWAAFCIAVALEVIGGMFGMGVAFTCAVILMAALSYMLSDGSSS